MFHEKLGTQGERVRRIAALARDLAPRVGAEPDEAGRAALLAKADLVSEMVGEFPELQGLMGRYYASAQGEAPAVAAAIEDHYRPQGPSDRVPTAPVSVAVALVGFWAIDETPTGSKDPYALRRAALGIVSILITNAISIRLRNILLQPSIDRVATLRRRDLDALSGQAREEKEIFQGVLQAPEEEGRKNASSLLFFLADRLKVYLRDKGARHDLIDAVFALPGQDDLVLVVRRVEALGSFLDGEDGRNLLAGYRRAANILKAEEKRDGAGAFEGFHDAALFALSEERDLADVLARVSGEVAERAGAEDFEGAMRSLSSLRSPVDAFFERVTVNAEDAALRLNRLRLLAALRRTMQAVADFGCVSG